MSGRGENLFIQGIETNAADYDDQRDVTHAEPMLGPKVDRWQPMQGNHRLEAFLQGSHSKHWMVRVAAKLLVNTARAYYYDPKQRGEIESWMAGDDAPLPFESMCWLLGLDSHVEVVAYIRGRRNGKEQLLRKAVPAGSPLYREGKRPKKTIDRKDAGTALGANRKRRHAEGNTRLARHLAGLHDLVRVEDREPTFVELPARVDRQGSE